MQGVEIYLPTPTPIPTRSPRPDFDNPEIAFRIGAALMIPVSENLGIIERNMGCRKYRGQWQIWNGEKWIRWSQGMKIVGGVLVFQPYTERRVALAQSGLDDVMDESAAGEVRFIVDEGKFWSETWDGQRWVKDPVKGKVKP